jgi:hypothetical protein
MLNADLTDFTGHSQNLVQDFTCSENAHQCKDVQLCRRLTVKNIGFGFVGTQFDIGIRGTQLRVECFMFKAQFLDRVFQGDRCIASFRGDRGMPL